GGRPSGRATAPGEGGPTQPAGCAPAGAGDKNGPSRCTPRTRAPAAGAPAIFRAERNAVASLVTGAVMNVGRNAVVPVSGNRRATRAQPSGSQSARSTP